MALGVSITEGQSSTPATEAALDDFVAANDGIEPALYTIWSQWGARGADRVCDNGERCFFPASSLQMLHDRGIQGVVWWEPIDPTDPDDGYYSRHKQTYKLKNHDHYIDAWADQARAFGQANGTKVILRLAHEANGTWFPWTVGYKDNTAYTFKRFWRYVHTKFKNRGALPYVEFLWSVTNKQCYRCNPYKEIFPGRAYVDYVGITAFNWGKQRRWKPMVKQLEKPLQQLKQVAGNKPVIVAELASHYRPVTKSKAAWIKNGYNKTYQRWARIKAIMYLDSDEPKKIWNHPDWRLRKPDDGSAQRAYAEISAKWRFQGSLLD